MSQDLAQLHVLLKVRNSTMNWELAAERNLPSDEDANGLVWPGHSGIELMKSADTEWRKNRYSASRCAA